VEGRALLSRRTTGAAFCAIAAFLFGLRYVVAAQLFDGMNPGAIDPSTLDQFLDYAGTPLLTGSVVALVVGIVYLVWAELEDLLKRDH
jgi:hypothetical protein